MDKRPFCMSGVAADVPDWWHHDVALVVFEGVIYHSCAHLRCACSGLLLCRPLPRRVHVRGWLRMFRIGGTTTWRLLWARMRYTTAAHTYGALAVAYCCVGRYRGVCLTARSWGVKRESAPAFLRGRDARGELYITFNHKSLVG